MTSSSALVTPRPQLLCGQAPIQALHVQAPCPSQQPQEAWGGGLITIGPTLQILKLRRREQQREVTVAMGEKILRVDWSVA